MIYLDTETDLIQPGLLAPPIACLQFAIDDGPVGVAVQDVDPVEDLARQLLQGEVTGQNVAYDMLVLMRAFPGLTGDVFKAYAEERVADTLIREKLLCIEKGTLKKTRSFSLQALGEKYGIAKDSADPWRLRYGELRGTSFEEWPEAAQEYAIHDVEATRHVYQAQGEASPDEGRQVRAAFVMHCIGAAGIFTDPEAVDAYEALVQDQYEEDKAILIDAQLVKPDGVRNTKAAKARMVACVGDDYRKTKKGDVSLDETACELAGDDLLSAYQRYGSHKNLLTRLQGLKLGYITPINAHFNSLVETGRTSCNNSASATNGYQLQNPRRGVGERECFIPEPGEVILACDYDGFENGSLAQVCIWAVGFSKMAEAINRGMDIHLWAAAQMMGESYDDLLAIYQDPSHPRFEEVERVRQGCKIGNFGLPGGLGISTFVGYAKGFGLDITLIQSQAFKDNWLTTWPEMPLYFEWINNHPWVTGWRGKYEVEETTIKQLMSNRIRGGVKYTEACNSFFQGLSADAAKEAGFDLVRACEEGPLKEWKVWNFVHDEFLLRGPVDDGHRAAMVVKDLMERAAQKWTPDVRVTASPTLMHRWSKKAKAVWSGGELVPWEG